ncbi:T9SS type A sorting domain-containing protein [bacterium]|nr:T9SS type A sorting domain-containing protein [bacterium]
MKKLFLTIALMLIIPTMVLAIDFSPTVLRLSAPETVQYDFDGKNIEIPITVSGVPARTQFLVYTKDKGESVGAVRNGYLGWHYVHNIDTCVYLSEPYDFDTGKNTITWNGKNDDGAMVPAGDYTYYLWAFDFSSAKQRVCPGADANGGRTFDIERNKLTYLEKDESGQVLVRPVLYNFSGGNSSVAYKWILGGDPLDNTLLESTDFGIPKEWCYRSPFMGAFNPTDHSTTYVSFTHTETRSHVVYKYKWVPNGLSEKDDKWGTDLVWTHNIEANSGIVTDGDYLYMDTCNIRVSDPNSHFYIMDFDGTEVENFLLEWWIKPDEYTKDVGAAPYLNGGPQWTDIRGDRVFMGYWFCMFQMVNPKLYLETGDMDDFTMYCNMNGDYINDRQYQTDAETPWVCFGEGAPNVSTVYSDALYFVATPQDGMGAVSFCVMGPDGTGLGYCTFAGETAGNKRGVMFIDSGSAFDGIYTDNNSAQTTETGFISGLFYVGHDSIKGTITNSSVMVEENKPAAFTVEQNSPNPFNPTTSINFTIAEAGNVSVDVFNVAGQKVDTLVNGFMGAGTHSVVWDASRFSAGVYFYTVKTGNLSQTMKMTLLK